MNPLLIEESTKVFALLEAHPQLEEVLIGMAPPFKKLRNPLLRNSVAKVASLRQAAAVARIPVSDLVNRLRFEVGQAPIEQSTLPSDIAYLSDRPEWFTPEMIVETIDERTLGDDAPMPLVLLVKRGLEMAQGEILELKTDFLPAPGIDAMFSKGFAAWTDEVSRKEFHTYFTKRDR